MHPLEKETLKIIRQENLLHPGDHLLVGVSAGPDSMALLHVLARLSADLDIKLAASYVNHGLRPEESRREKMLAGDTAARLGLEFFAGDVHVKEFAAAGKLSIEHAARLLRYDFLRQTAEQCGATKIAVAHTADDQAEELLLRLIRGTGRKGLSGMKTLRDAMIIRPFLRFAKSRLLAYLEDNSIEFLLDSSNAENIYLRNRIRNDLLPYLAQGYNPDIRQTLLRTANILQDEEELLQNITENKFPSAVSVKHGATAGELCLNLEPFNSEPRAIQRRLLEKCCWEMGCEPRSRQIESLMHLAMKKTAGNSLHLSDGLRVTHDGEQLCFNYPQGKGPLRGNISDEDSPAFPETTIPSPGIFEFPQINKKLVVEQIRKTAEIAEEIFPSGEHLDSSLFSFPLTLRGPEPGDRFHPLGAPGSKKIGDFLTDQKVELRTRRLVPVLCSGDSILALPGLRIDHRYRVTDKTIHVTRVRWENIK